VRPAGRVLGWRVWVGHGVLAGRACSVLAVRLGESGGCQERGDGEQQQHGQGSQQAGVVAEDAKQGGEDAAGVVHEHRAYGPTVLHTIGLPTATNPLGATLPVVVAVGPLLRELLVAYASAPTPDSPRGRRLRAVILDELRAAPERPLHLPRPRDPRLAEVAALLQADPADRRSVTELARQVSSSPRTLARRCRDELGMTFPQWRTQLRLHHALQLLAENTPVTVVAVRCGWATPSAFIDVFRRTMGDTPAATHPPASRAGAVVVRACLQGVIAKSRRWPG
jgi:AraC-like DNA-binding protein